MHACLDTAEENGSSRHQQFPRRFYVKRIQVTWKFSRSVLEHARGWLNRVLHRIDTYWMSVRRSLNAAPCSPILSLCISSGFRQLLVTFSTTIFWPLVATHQHQADSLDSSSRSLLWAGYSSTPDGCAVHAVPSESENCLCLAF